MSELHRQDHKISPAGVYVEHCAPETPTGKGLIISQTALLPKQRLDRAERFFLNGDCYTFENEHGSFMGSTH